MYLLVYMLKMAKHIGESLDILCYILTKLHQNSKENRKIQTLWWQYQIIGNVFQHINYYTWNLG